MAEPMPPTVELDELIALFYSDPETLGAFHSVSASDCPAAYRTMLAHESHMTVTVERRHGCQVGVEVLEDRLEEKHYLRKILLRRQSDEAVVQYGIVRLALQSLQPNVRDEIMAKQTPLGRVLINHNVLRHVQLHGLWRVACGAELASFFAVPIGTITYGRTALIYCDGEPAVELIEIVSPES